MANNLNTYEFANIAVEAVCLTGACRLAKWLAISELGFRFSVGFVVVRDYEHKGL